MRALESRIAALEASSRPSAVVVRLRSYGQAGVIHEEACRITTGRGREWHRHEDETEAEFIARARREDAGRHAVLVIDNGSGDAQ